MIKWKSVNATGILNGIQSKTDANPRLTGIYAIVFPEAEVWSSIGRLLSFRRRITWSLRDGSTILRQPRVLDGIISIATLTLPYPSAFWDMVNFIPVEGESNCIFYNVFVLFRINNRAQLSMYLSSIYFSRVCQVFLRFGAILCQQKNHSVEGFWCQCACAFSFFCSSTRSMSVWSSLDHVSNSLRGAKLSRIVIYRSWKTCFWSLVREIENSLRGAKNLFREIENSLRGANNLFRESENSFRGEIYNRLWEANKSSIVPSTHFFRETMDYLVFETMNKAKTSPVFVEQRHLIERVECFCPSAFVIYVRIKLQFSSFKMFVVKGTCLVSSHQYSVQHFYKVFFFIPFLFPLLPLRFHFSLIFFSSILLCYISIPVLQ